MKAHQALIAGVKRGDEVVLSNGMVGKVTRVEDAEAMVEISQGVNVRVVKAMIAEVRNRTAIAANDKG
jgi:preprotein translocase subunit YajC